MKNPYQRMVELWEQAGREVTGLGKAHVGKRAKDVKDPDVRSAVETENERTSKKLGVKVNMDAGQALQQKKARTGRTTTRDPRPASYGGNPFTRRS